VRIKLAAIVSMMLLGASTARAQQDVSFSHYWMTMPYYNPAAVGVDNKLNVVAGYNYSFAGFENNPKTMYASADIPFYFAKSFHGAGVNFINDQIGHFTHTRINVEYAFKRRLLGGMISAGVQLALLSESFDMSDLELIDSSDPVFSGSSSITGSGFDIGLGLYYTHGNWYAGASMLHATAPSIDLGSNNIYKVARSYYLTGGYNIKFRNPFIKLHTSVLGRSDGTAYRGDLTARLVYTNDKKMMYAGAGYSPTNSATIYIGGSFHGINLAYSYEIYTSAISVGNGSHELMVSYQTDIDFAKKGKTSTRA